jgi:hypothetical protein
LICHRFVRRLKPVTALAVAGCLASRYGLLVTLIGSLPLLAADFRATGGAAIVMPAIAPYANDEHHSTGGIAAELLAENRRAISI